MKLVVIMLLLAPCVHAQTFLVSGGTSSLFGSSGAGMTMYLPNHTITTGIGSSPTGIHFGFSDQFKFHGYDMTAGDQFFSFSMLTIVERGITVQKHYLKTCANVLLQQCTREKRLIAFVGSVGNSFSTPFFSSYSVDTAGAGVMFQEMFDHGEFDTLESVHAKKFTALQFGEYTWSKIRMSADGGLLENTPRIDAQASVRPVQGLLFAVGHNVVQLTNQRSFVSYDSAQAAGSISRYSVYASVFNGGHRLSESGGVSVRLPYQVSVTTAYFNTTHQSRAWFGTASKQFGRFEVNSSYSVSNGVRGLGFGGSIRTNKFRVGVTNQMMYDIQRGQFAPTISGHVEFRIHDTRFNLDLLKPSKRKIEYTTYGSSYIQGRFAPVAAQAQRTELGGKYVVHGVATDIDGSPLEGVAIKIGDFICYSDTDGEFMVRLRRDKQVPVTVLVNEMALPGDWTVVSAPATVVPGQIKIVVKRVP